REDGLITRTAYAEVPPRVEYALAPLGRGLHEVVARLIDWVTEHHDEVRANRGEAGTTAVRS
ncbi:helix-turn-helix transcriptional regulator, partial [Streptomyces sp. SID11233]|nr:helix-turn-helix transcriptional regulator [Streptomyces sp. SID11233]